MNPVIPPKRNRKIQRDYDQEIYKSRDTLLKMLFFTLNAGAALQQDMRKTQNPFLLQFIFGASLFGLISRDYTI
jgi:low temperature requirement protein LtrA